MATFEEEDAQRQALKAALDDLNKIVPESLVRADVLGKELSFELGLNVFRRTLTLFRDLSECNLDNVPHGVLNQLSSLALQALSQFQQIQKFSVEQHPSNPKSVRDTLIAQLRDHWDSYYTNITPHISYSIRRGTDFDALEREARGSLTFVKQIATEVRTNQEKLLAEMQGALEKVRQAAAEAGVAQHAIHFKQEADSHNIQSYVWLGTAIILASGTAIYAFYSLGIQLHDIAESASTHKLVVLGLSRLIVLSVLSWAVIFCARNYAASRHNFVINRHRQNALSTFETFVKAARDDQTKDAVLVKATQSIFAPQTSGYLKGFSDQPAGGQIVEVVRSMTSSKE